MTTSSDTKADSTKDAKVPRDQQAIYIDRITEIGLGSGVSRLTLGMEISPNEYENVGKLILPTQSLLDAVQFITQTMLSNEELRNKLINGLDEVMKKMKAYEPKSR